MRAGIPTKDFIRIVTRYLNSKGITVSKIRMYGNTPEKAVNETRRPEYGPERWDKE